jgi:hypothetical protein
MDVNTRRSICVPPRFYSDHNGVLDAALDGIDGAMGEPNETAGPDARQ